MIETDRLVLRPAVDADRPAVAAMNADPRVAYWLGGVRGRADSDLFLERCAEHIARHGFGFWVVERKADGRVIGMTGLWHAPDNLPEAGKVEVGWRLAAEVWGQGYATEAARAALDHGFKVLELPEIVAWTARTNLASQAVMRRIGMVPVPERDFDHPALAQDDPLRPHVTYVARP